MAATDRWLAATSGVLTGAAAGLIGVGGGEFRIPVLIRWLRLPVGSASAANLLIGLCTVVTSVARRIGQTAFSPNDVELAVVMGISSLAGAAIGVLSRSRIPHRPLLRIVRSYLILVGAWMIVEAFSHSEHVWLDPQGVPRLVLAGVLAFVIAVASGILGVAGGEMRIPALMYLFAVPIKLAGTVSLVASIPTVAAGAITDWRLGQLQGHVLRIAMIMAAASVVGVLVGALFVPSVHRDLLKGLLGAILLAASIRLTVPAASPGRAGPQ